MVKKWLSPAGGALDCEGVDWGIFNVVLFTSIVL